MADVKRNGSIINTLKQHALTAISYLIPIVVGGGFLLAIGSLMGGAAIEDFNAKWGFADTLYTIRYAASCNWYRYCFFNCR